MEEEKKKRTNAKKHNAYPIEKTEAGLAAKQRIDNVVAATRPTAEQQRVTSRYVLTSWIVLDYVFRYAIEQAGGVEALGAIVTERNAHDQAITHAAKGGNS